MTIATAVQTIAGITLATYSPAGAADAIREITAHLTHDEFFAVLSSVEASTIYVELTKDARGGGTPNRKRRERMVIWQDGICVKCGGGLVDAELAHHVRASAHNEELEGLTGKGGGRGGFVEGNLSVWCGECNRTHGEVDVTTADLKRPDLIWRDSWNALPKLTK